MQPLIISLCSIQMFLGQKSFISQNRYPINVILKAYFGAPHNHPGATLNFPSKSKEKIASIVESDIRK